MKRNLLVMFVLFALFTLTISASAKGIADVVLVTHPSLQTPLEITDPQVLERLNPWAGQFIGTGGSIDYPPDVGERLPYQIYMAMEQPNGDLDILYMFYYYPAPNPDMKGSRGYIYLPGSGDPFHRVNTGTIIRSEADGHWFYAMPFLQDLVPAQDAAGIQMDSTGSGFFQRISAWFSAQFQSGK